MKLKTLVIFAVAALGMGSVSYGQIIPFQVFGEGDITGAEVSATGSINFNNFDALGGFKIVVTISNSSPEASDPSFISAFYLRQPVNQSGTNIAPGNSEGLVGPPASPPVSLPETWSVGTAFNNAGNVLPAWPGGSLSYSDYYGAYAGSPLANGVYNGTDNDLIYRLSQPAVFTFSFIPDEDDMVFDKDAWLAAGVAEPLMFVRWQAITPFDDSAKGYGGTSRGFEPAVVPEPSEVALMAMLGLGGLLWTRKRFMKK